MNKPEILFSKIRPEARIPSKLDENAGYDIYPCFDADFINILPLETKVIPTGIASAFSDDFYFQLFERGSTGIKGIGQRCGVIDSGYRNEWLVPITNLNKKMLVITKNKNQDEIKNMEAYFVVHSYYKAICQAVFLPVIKTVIKEIDYEQLKAIESKRMMGGFGSSGK